MLKQWLNYKTILTIAAIIVVSYTIIYVQHLSKKIEKDERQKIEQWAEALTLNADTSYEINNLTTKILTENSLDIPIILVNEKDSILDYRNLDSNKIKHQQNYILQQLQSFKTLHTPIVWTNPLNKNESNKVYYGNSNLLMEIRYYPIIQLLLITLFIVIIISSLNIAFKSTQNQLWAGMAKETAHQLGTPVSSLQGWIEILKENHQQPETLAEMEKDVNRLKLITDRFGKIGSTPQLENCNINHQLKQMMDYMKKRSSNKVEFIFKENNEAIFTKISTPLFDWVIENLLKNALDSMEEKGTIKVSLQQQNDSILISISDTGKGIAKQHINKIFKPGFTTKKRGWGLGLALSKRIIEQYHNGKIYVAQSQQSVGTTFEIKLPIV